MSDGPHKSLPLRQHWRNFARRASNPACSTSELTEVLAQALIREFANAPVEDIRSILGGGVQPSLFAGDRTRPLEELRLQCGGAVAAIALIDCAIEVADTDLNGDRALATALENALETRLRDSFRSIEEHYLREAGNAAANDMRERLKAARRRCDYRRIARKIMSGEKAGVGNKRSGIDEGPAL